MATGSARLWYQTRSLAVAKNRAMLRVIEYFAKSLKIFRSVLRKVTRNDTLE